MIPEKAFQWYQNKTVMHEIVRDLTGREVGLKPELEEKNPTIKMIRCLKIFSVAGWSYNLERLDFRNRAYSVFRSVARLNYKEFPNPPAEFEKLADYRKEFLANYSKMVYGYDYVIDVDLKSDFDGKMDYARRVFSYLKHREVPFIVNASGRGFHFRIEWEDLSKELSIPAIKMPAICGNVTQGIVNRINENLPEDKKIPFGSQQAVDYIYDLIRVFRCLYTLNPKADFKVVLPLSDEQFLNFKPEHIEIEHVLANNNLFQRGSLKRKGKEGAIAKLFQDFGDLNGKEE